MAAAEAVALCILDPHEGEPASRAAPDNAGRGKGVPRGLSGGASGRRRWRDGVPPPYGARDARPPPLVRSGGVTIEILNIRHFLDKLLIEWFDFPKDRLYGRSQLLPNMRERSPLRACAV